MHLRAGVLVWGGGREGRSGLTTADGRHFGARNLTRTEESSSRHLYPQPLWLPHSIPSPNCPPICRPDQIWLVSHTMSPFHWVCAGRDVMSCRDRWTVVVVVLSLVRCHRRRRHIPPDIAEPWQ